MNQILENKHIKLFKKRKYITILCICFIFIIGIMLYFFFKKYNEKHISEISNITAKSYNIIHLYSNDINSDYIANNNNAMIIGTIKIQKINISYPIFSEYSEELLKLSVCKLYGPDINTSGNLCIIGHNYNNDEFFSNLSTLQINDVIDIYDLKSNSMSYYLYERTEVEPDNLNYLNQDTHRYT